MSREFRCHDCGRVIVGRSYRRTVRTGSSFWRFLGHTGTALHRSRVDLCGACYARRQMGSFFGCALLLALLGGLALAVYAYREEIGDWWQHFREQNQPRKIEVPALRERLPAQPTHRA